MDATMPERRPGRHRGRGRRDPRPPRMAPPPSLNAHSSGHAPAASFNQASRTSRSDHRACRPAVEHGTSLNPHSFRPEAGRRSDLKPARMPSSRRSWWMIVSEGDWVKVPVPASARPPAARSRQVSAPGPVLQEVASRSKRRGRHPEPSRESATSSSARESYDCVNALGLLNADV
jgi:hypothetical protein